MPHTLDHIAAQRQEALTASRWAGLQEFFAADHPTWEEFGRSGEAFFYDPDAPVSTVAFTPSGIETPMFPVFSLGSLARQLGAGSRADDPPQLPGAGWWGALWGDRASDAAAPPAPGPTEDEEGPLPAALDYLQGIPGAAGAAGGEFFANLFGPPLGTLAAVPGSVFENIPLWVPLLGAAWLLFGGKK